jgi:foldase protein PrsA
MKKLFASRMTWMITSFILLVALIAVIVKPVQDPAKTAAVAYVNNDKITKDQLYASMLDNGGKQTLDNMINELIVNQAAQKAGITVTDQDVQTELDALKKQMGSEDMYQQALQQYGMTEAKLKEQLHMQAALKKLLADKISVTDDAIKTYYDQNKQQYATPEQVQLSQIVVKTKDDAAAIVSQLKGGADFAALAKEKSTDTNSKDKGGALDYVSKGTLDPAVEKAAFALKTGEISDPVQAANGSFYVLKVTDHKAAATPTLEEKKADIKNELESQQLSQLSPTWLDEQKSKATIKNLLAS